MALIDSLTSQLDSLLNDEDSVQPTEEKETTDDEWENIEDEVSDYFSVLGSGNKEKKRVRSDPLFPSDVTKAPKLFDVQIRAEFVLRRKIKLETHHEGAPAHMQTKIEKSGIANNQAATSKSVQAKNLKNTNLTAAYQKELVSSSDVAIKTIAELSKRVRELNSQLIVTQNKLRLAEAKVLSATEPNNKEAKESSKNKEPVESADDKTSLLEKQIKELNEKLCNSNSKLYEAKNQVQQQKHEIKVLQKAITSEVGENVNLQTVTTEGWRGRAQQIMSLQLKVNDLTEKLSQTSLPSIDRTTSSILLAEKAQDKEKITSLTTELEEAKQGFNDMKQRNDQARARAKVLTNELNSFKARFEAQVSKNEEDVKLINSLTARLTSLSQKFHEREKNLVKDYEEKLEALNNEYKQEKLKSEKLKKIIMDRDTTIEKLEEKLKDQRENGIEERPPSSWSTFMERPPSNRSSFGNVLPSTELERMRLMELVTVLNKRLDEERKSREKIEEQFRLEKHRSVRLETKCSRLELEKAEKGGFSRRVSSSATRAGEANKAELSAAKDRIALLEEKILALESRMERLRKEKEEESRIYIRMVEETRQAMKEYTKKNPASSNMSLP